MPSDSYTPDPALVELVAQAIYEAGAAQIIGEVSWEEQNERNRDWHRTSAHAALAALATEGRLRRNYDHDWYPDHDGLCVTCHLPGGQCPASPATRAATARITLAAVQGGPWLPAPTETKEN